MQAALAILIVSDYAGGEEKSWSDLRKAVEAWAEQDVDEPVDYVLVESERYRDAIPRDVFERLPELRVVYSPSDTSYEMKNQGVDAIDAELVGIVDADCVPGPSWVRRMAEALRRHPGLAAVSGLTTYPGRNRMEHILGLLGRSYIDPGAAGKTRFISGNAAGYRRAVYLDQRLPERLGAFAARVQSEALLRKGWSFFFDPEMRTIHDFEGWSMESDIRRNTGYCTVLTRQVDPQQPHAWAVRLGPAAIPLIVAGKTLLNFGDIVRCFRHYEVRWYEIPLALGLSVWTHLMEIPGMWRAFRNEPLGGTAYR